MVNSHFLRSWPRCFIAAIFCLALQTHAHGEDQSADSDSQPVPFSVQLLDMDGRPVEGADLGIVAGVGGEVVRELAAKEKTEWYYGNHLRSDAAGTAHFPDGEALSRVCLVARHEGRKIAVFANVDPQLDKPIKLTLRPEHDVVGEAICKELAERKREIGEINVNVYSDEKIVLECHYDTPAFRLPLPPGDYVIEAYGGPTHGTKKPITVKAQSGEQCVEPVELHATQLALLEGQSAPEIPDVVAWKNSKPITIAGLRGKCVLLEFWGYWCGPCVASMPELFQLHDKYHDQGLVVIGVHMDLGEDEKESVDTVAKLDERLTETRKDVWKGRDIPFPVALVSAKKTSYGEGVENKARSAASARYGVWLYPTQVLIDRKGNVVKQFWSSEENNALLEKLLHEK